MEDNKIETQEDENLNLEGGQDNNSDEDQKTTYTAEEVETIRKQMQSDSEKGVQKIIWEKKAYERAMQELSNISEDPTKLVELYEENPKAAQVILDTYYDGQDIDSFKDSISYKEDYTDPKKIEKLVEEKARILAEQKQIQDDKNAFIKKLKMTDEEIKSFEEAFEERKQLKSFKVSDLQKHLEKAYREVNDNTDALKEIKKQEAIANTMATWEGKGWKEATSKKQNNLQKNSEYNKNFLKERWIL